VVVALAALIAAGSLAIDVGMLWTARTQLQGVADGAALAAALNMIDKDTPAVTIPAAEDAAVDNATQNFAGASSSVTVDIAEMSFGDWDLDARTLDTSVDLTQPENVTGVQVVAHLSDTQNRPVPAFLSRILGHEDFSVTSSATAYLGYAGRLSKRAPVLPIAVDCCEISGPACEDNYCDTITNNPPQFGNTATKKNGDLMPCFLEDGVTPATCLDMNATGNQIACWTQFDGDHQSIGASDDMNATGNQIACWTQFDGDHQSIGASDLKQIINEGTQFEIGVGEHYHVDNGTKSPVIADIKDRFYGEGEYNASPDPDVKDTNGDGKPDSWVVALPVVECQTEDGCSPGSAPEMVGVVCFDIQEVVASPDNRIKGRFLCKEDIKYDDCDVGRSGTGGKDFDVRADFPVLVR
jgi:hypothetical protein